MPRRAPARARPATPVARPGRRTRRTATQPHPSHGSNHATRAEHEVLRARAPTRRRHPTPPRTPRAALEDSFGTPQDGPPGRAPRGPAPSSHRCAQPCGHLWRSPRARPHPRGRSRRAAAACTAARVGLGPPPPRRPPGATRRDLGVRLVLHSVHSAYDEDEPPRMRLVRAQLVGGRSGDSASRTRSDREAESPGRMPGLGRPRGLAGRGRPVCRRVGDRAQRPPGSTSGRTPAAPAGAPRRGRST